MKEYLSMRIEWLAKEGNNRLILIFAGWGTDASFYVGCLHEGWDLAVASGYSDLSFPDDILLPYHSVVVFAWSMGVYAASRVMTSDRVALAVAVNGTESPADDRSGIPTAIFDGTADSLNERNLMKFRRRMTGKDYDNVRTRLEGCAYGIEQLRDELRWIRQESSVSYGGRLRWQRAYISTGDLIFPPESQRRAWMQNPYSPEIVTLDAPHYVDMSEIIHSILPAGRKVGERFMKASTTYDSQAHAQREITRHLAEMSPEDGIYRRVVEIGPGTGMLTRIIDEKWHPTVMELVDLYPTGRFDITAEQRLHIADAEEWIENMAEREPGSIDAIVSASAIQWFADPRRFFRNAARLLRPGGLLLCSTFLPDNMKELQRISPYGLVYRSREELEGYLDEYFDAAKLSEKRIEMRFDNARDTLLHLRQTGVGGTARAQVSISALLGMMPTELTYHALCIAAERRNTD